MHATTLCSRFAALALFTLLSGCHPHGATKPLALVTPNRGEAIFRLQNTVMDHLISAQVNAPAVDDANGVALAAREDQLVEQCASINQAADLSAVGSKPGAILKLRVLFSLSSCEQAAIAARDFLAVDRPIIAATLP